MERPKPYVGVSGVVSERRVEPNGTAWRNPQDLLIEKIADDAGLFDAGCKLALGVKATYATQGLDRPQKRGGVTYGNEWYPVGKQEFASALHRKGRNDNVMGIAQAYAGPHPYGPNAEHYRKFIDTVMSRGEQWITALQFDGLGWHGSSDAALQFVAETKRKYSERDLQIILQVGREAMKALEPDDVARKLGRYADAIDYVVFDASDGGSRRMQPDVMDEYLDTVHSSEQLSGVGFAVAGGLDADAVSEDLPFLLQKYPDLSWELDETKHHPLNNIWTHSLQMDRVEDSLQASVKILRKYR